MNNSIGRGIARLRADRRLTRIPQEEHRRVVGHEIPVTLVRLELDAETSGVPRSVRRTRLSTDGREPGGQGGLAALLEHVGETEVGKVVGAFKDSVGTGTASREVGGREGGERSC